MTEDPPGDLGRAEGGWAGGGKSGVAVAVGAVTQESDTPATRVRVSAHARQGDADGFYKDGTLLPENFVAAAQAGGVPVEFRWQRGYDHSYYFVQTFVDDHLAHHHRFLNA